MNEELVKELKGMIPWVVAAALAVGCYHGVKGYLAKRAVDASEAVVNAYTVEELEEAVGRFGGVPAGGALRLRLAKKYFDSMRYDDALKAYDELAGSAPDGFEDVPPVGRAQCLEALGRGEEALKAYEAFAEARPGSYLALTARLGAVRATALLGDKAKALEMAGELKKSVAGDELSVARVNAVEDCVKRYSAAAK